MVPKLLGSADGAARRRLEKGNDLKASIIGHQMVEEMSAHEARKQK